jgi:hypothetical protein
MNKEMLLAAVNHEQESLPKDWRLQVMLDMVSLLTLIGALQIAMRHPQFKKTTSHAMIRRIIDTLISGIPEDMPATRELARLGDKPKFDV